MQPRNRPTLHILQAKASKQHSVQEAGRAWAVAQHLKETSNRFCSSRFRSSRRRGGGRRAAWKQQALIQPTDSEQHDAETDEGEALIDSREIAHVDEEYFEDSEDDHRGRGEPHRL